MIYFHLLFLTAGDVYAEFTAPPAQGYFFLLSVGYRFGVDSFVLGSYVGIFFYFSRRHCETALVRFLTREAPFTFCIVYFELYPFSHLL